VRLGVPDWPRTALSSATTAVGGVAAGLPAGERFRGNAGALTSSATTPPPPDTKPDPRAEQQRHHHRDHHPPQRQPNLTTRRNVPLSSKGTTIRAPYDQGLTDYQKRQRAGPQAAARQHDHLPYPPSPRQRCRPPVLSRWQSDRPACRGQVFSSRCATSCPFQIGFIIGSRAASQAEVAHRLALHAFTPKTTRTPLTSADGLSWSTTAPAARQPPPSP
jgi:hypothetical protein